jgi:hypothetical protein
MLKWYNTKLIIKFVINKLNYFLPAGGLAMTISTLNLMALPERPERNNLYDLFYGIILMTLVL